MTAREYLGPLSERPFRMLWLGQTASSVGDAVIYIALVFAVLDVGSKADLGLVLAAFWLARTLFLLVGGVWADRLPRRAIMLACDGVRAAIEAFTCVMVLRGDMEIWMFLVTSAVFGAAAAMFGPASTGLIPQLVSGEGLQRANALLGLSRSAVNIAGPAVSGVLVAAFGPGWVFGINSFSFVISAAFLVVLRVPPRAAPERQTFFADLARGWREVSSRTWLWASMIVFSLSNIAIAALTVLSAVVADEELGGATALGIMGAGASVGSVLGGVYALRARPSRPLLVQFLIMIPLAFHLFLLIPPAPLAVLTATAAAWVFGVQAGNAMWEANLQRRIPQDAMSRVSSYDWLVSIVFMPVGLTLAPIAADSFGLDTTLAACAALTLVANLAILLVPSVRNLRGIGVTPAGAVPAAPAPHHESAGGAPQADLP
jgi:MFS family permease